MKQSKVASISKRISRSHKEDGVSQEATECSTYPLPQPYRLPDPFRHLTEEDLERLNQAAQDYQLVHGGLLKDVSQEHNTSASGHTIGISLHPSPFPARLFRDACELQTLFQELYVAVARDRQWLGTVLKDLVASDPLTRTLWAIIETARSDGSNGSSAVSAAVCRSDYMIHVDSEHNLQLKQVEFNTIACAGSVHGQRVCDMHRFFHQSGQYTSNAADSIHTQQHGFEPVGTSSNVEGICRTLETAHNMYLDFRQSRIAQDQLRPCVLMVVQPHNFNIADERAYEYRLWSRDPTVPCFRVQWGEDLLQSTSKSLDGCLRFQPRDLAEKFEVSVVYFRAGFEPREYQDRIAYDLRVRLEASNAIQCPDVLFQLVGSKRVQQALCEPGALEHFISVEKSQRLRSSFMPMFPLDDSARGQEGRKLATNADSARKYVLKPSREGGGHNVYRDDIPPFLKSVPSNRWPEHVLMEMIEPVVGRNALTSWKGLWSGDVIAELGIWGGCIWAKTAADSEMSLNEQIGWSVRSKSPNVDEMSVVKGFGCFDSVVLLDDDSGLVVN